MSAPLLTDPAPPVLSLALAVLLGAGFGVALERAGLGNARKLVGQFYGRDFTVLKVLFTALLVAMLGVFWLARAGMLDPAGLYVPPAFLLPQLAGGIVFGAGLIAAGLCPGTACVAAASGRIDGAIVLAGVFAGVLVSGLALSVWPDAYTVSARGAWTLPELFDLPYGAVVGAVVVLALGTFAAIEHLERGAR